MAPKGQNLSRGVSIYLAFMRECVAQHEDVDAFYAPSECHTDVTDGNIRRFRTVRRHIHGVTGLRWRPFVREVRRRTTARFVYIYNLPYEDDARPDFV